MIRRYLASFLALLMLLLAIALLILWPRSAGGADVLAAFGPGGRISGLVSSEGQLVLVLSNVQLDDRRAGTIHTLSLDDADTRTLRTAIEGDGSRLWKQLGFLLKVQPHDAFSIFPDKWHFALGAPHWTVAILSLILPFMRLRRWRIGCRRARRGQCLQCGYDLRATADFSGPRHARCPECGAMADGSAPPGPSASASTPTDPSS